MKVYLPLSQEEAVQAIKEGVEDLGSRYVRCYELDGDRVVIKIQFMGVSKLIFRVRDTKDGGAKVKLLREVVNIRHAKYKGEVKQAIEELVENLGGWVYA